MNFWDAVLIVPMILTTPAAIVFYAVMLTLWAWVTFATRYDWWLLHLSGKPGVRYHPPKW